VFIEDCMVTWEVAVFGFASLFCMWAFGKVWYIRVSPDQRASVRRNFGTWQIFYAGLGFATEAVQEYHPYPSNLRNPYYWVFGIITVAAVCHHFWSEKRLKGQRNG